MKEFKRILTRTKLERMIYFIIILWTAFAILAHIYLTPFVDLSGYFVSMVGFVSSYIYGESKTPSKATPLFTKGKNSTREIMMYVLIILWFGFGCLGIIEGASLIEFSSYFATLTPFVGGYIIGKSTEKPEESENVEENNVLLTS